MSQKSSFVKRLWNYCTRLRSPAKKFNDKFVGTDHLGNRYFIRPQDPARGVNKEHRYIHPSDKVVDEYVDRMGMGVPMEWNAWLRHTRDTIPTDEEIEINKIKQLKVMERAKELDRKDKLSKAESLDAPDAQSFTETIQGDTTKKSFPVYEEFENIPGTSRTKYKP